MISLLLSLTREGDIGDEVDKRIKQRSLDGLKAYDGLTHQGMFSLPRHLRNELSKPARLITDAEPLYIFQDHAV